MMQNQVMTLSAAIARAAATARVDILSESTPLNLGMAVLLTQNPPPPSQLAEFLWAVAGLQLAMGRAFEVAWQGRGRAIVETTFALHALLGQASAQSHLTVKE